MKANGVLLLVIVYFGIDALTNLTIVFGGSGYLPSFFFLLLSSGWSSLLSVVVFLSLIYVLANNRSQSSTVQSQLKTNHLKQREVKELTQDGYEDKVLCGSCGKRMVPRIITGAPLVNLPLGGEPVLKKSVCPFCGAVHQSFPASPGQIVLQVMLIMIVMALFVTVIFSGFRF